MTQKYRENGFSLLELIVVFATLAIIIAIAAPHYFGIQEKAQKTADQREAEILADYMKQALVEGTLWVDENRKGKPVLKGYNRNHDEVIVGSKSNGENFKQVFDPIYGSDPIIPDSEITDKHFYRFTIDAEQRIITINLMVPKPNKPENYKKQSLTSFGY